MTPEQEKHSLLMLKSDLNRPSLNYLRLQLEDIVATQQASIDQHGNYLTTTADSDLARLKSAAVLNKARLEAAQHLLLFFNEEALTGLIETKDALIKRGEINV